MNNLYQIWVFIGLAGFIFVSSCLFFAVVSHPYTFSLISKEQKGQMTTREIEIRE